MIVMHKLKTVYIDPLKTGSQTLDTVFKKHNGKYIKNYDGLDKHCRVLSEDLLEYTTIASVRNPYTRALSLYEMDKRKKLSWWSVRLDNFENYMQDIVKLNQENTQSDDVTVYRYFPCYKYLEPFRIDKIIKLENIYEDLKSFGFGTQVRTVNKGSYKSKWSDIKTPTLVKLVNQWAGKDFEYYGYDRL